MSRRGWPPPPPPEEVAERAVNVVVRDFPESVAALRREGVDPRGAGGQMLKEAAADALPAVLAALEAALAWRARG